jgi:hypothetical protein
MKKSKDGYWIREYLRNNTINTNYVFSYFNKKFMVLFEPINPGVSLKIHCGKTLNSQEIRMTLKTESLHLWKLLLIKCWGTSNETTLLALGK